jgi:hypothetical protein
MVEALNVDFITARQIFQDLCAEGYIETSFPRDIPEGGYERGCVRTETPEMNLMWLLDGYLLCVKPFRPWPSSSSFVGGTSRVVPLGKRVASWWCGPERTGALHRRLGRSAKPRPRFQTHAWGSSAV